MIEQNSRVECICVVVSKSGLVWLHFPSLYTLILGEVCSPDLQSVMKRLDCLNCSITNVYIVGNL